MSRPQDFPFVFFGGDRHQVCQRGAALRAREARLQHVCIFNVAAIGTEATGRRDAPEAAAVWVEERAEEIMNSTPPGRLLMSAE